jgi:hypothetical protein
LTVCECSQTRAGESITRWCRWALGIGRRANRVRDIKSCAARCTVCGSPECNWIAASLAYELTWRADASIRRKSGRCGRRAGAERRWQDRHKSCCRRRMPRCADIGPPIDTYLANQHQSIIDSRSCSGACSASGMSSKRPWTTSSAGPVLRSSDTTGKHPLGVSDSPATGDAQEIKGVS